MIIYREKQALLFRLKEPSRVLTVIPTAKKIWHQAHEFVAVPHRPDEVRVLRSLGFDPPDPMPAHYGFPGHRKPFAVQVETSNFLTLHSRAFCLNAMGSGKTASALWAFDYMRSVRQAKRALVVCPLSVMERTWADSVFRMFPTMQCNVLYGTRERRLKLLRAEADVYIINIDGVKIIQDELKDRKDIDLIVVDELAMARNSTTARWKALNVVCNKQVPRRVWGLTGMPTPNLPTDAWAQCRLITPTNPDLPSYFNRAQDRLMRKVSMFKWVPRVEANDIVKGWMQPAIRYSLEDCVDLPPQIFIERSAELTPEQEKAYKEMLQKLRTEYASGQILAVNEAVKANKLLQIAVGVAYGEGHDEVIIPAKPRMETLEELVEESEGKVIVFVPFTGALKHVAEELSKRWEVRVVHGATGKAERDEIFQSFQNTASPHVLVANAGTMAHGLTLTAATTVVWFAPVWSFEMYDQANARVRRPGQTRSTVIAHIAGTAIERKIYERLQNKQSMANTLLEMMKGDK